MISASPHDDSPDMCSAKLLTLRFPFSTTGSATVERDYLVNYNSPEEIVWHKK